MADSQTDPVVETIARFAREVLAPAAAELDHDAISASRHRADLAHLGAFGMNVPEQFGGTDLDPITLSTCVESIAGACASTASMLTAHFLATDALKLAQDNACCERTLQQAATGNALGAFALSEPGAGSNPADMRCRAEARADGYRLQGRKHFISNAGEADFIVVYAMTDTTAGHRGISAFVLDANTPGIVAGTPEPTMGIRGGHIFEIDFDCNVPASRRINAEGSGFRNAMQVLDNGRTEVAAMCHGIAQSALDAALRWAGEREVGGQILHRYQGIGWMLADMSTELAASRALLGEALRMRQNGERFTRQASMAKLFATEMAARVTDGALQIHGGYGYTTAFALERYVRDARIMRIYEGSSEIQRNIIAGDLFTALSTD